MTGAEVKAMAEAACAALDGFFTMATLRRATIVASIPIVVGACFYAEPAYGMPFDPELCGDNVDNDDDGRVDCEDTECEETEACIGSCADGLDDDGNGLTDCDDSSCDSSEACFGGCDDGADNDGDGQSDCADSDCAGAPGCP